MTGLRDMALEILTAQNHAETHGLKLKLFTRHVYRGYFHLIWNEGGLDFTSISHLIVVMVKPR